MKLLQKQEQVLMKVTRSNPNKASGKHVFVKELSDYANEIGTKSLARRPRHLQKKVFRCHGKHWIKVGDEARRKNNVVAKARQNAQWEKRDEAIRKLIEDINKSRKQIGADLALRKFL